MPLHAAVVLVVPSEMVAEPESATDRKVDAGAWRGDGCHGHRPSMGREVPNVSGQLLPGKDGDAFSVCRAVRLANPKSITIQNDIIPAETVAPGPPRGASNSGTLTLVYTVGHGQPPISSSDSDDDDSAETAAETTTMKLTTMVTEMTEEAVAERLSTRLQGMEELEAEMNALQLDLRNRRQ